MSMPKKCLEDMLSENTERPEVKGNAKRQAVFLAYWDEIESAYKKGWSYMDIWQALNREGIFDFGYSTFMHYKDKRRRRIREVEKEHSRIGVAKVEPEGGPAEPQRHRNYTAAECRPDDWQRRGYYHDHPLTVTDIPPKRCIATIHQDL